METFNRVRKVSYDYGIPNGEEAVEIARKFNGYIAENHPGCPHLEGKIWVKDDELVGSTPQARDVLARKIVVGDFARQLKARVATHKDGARIYNDEKDEFDEDDEKGKTQYFFRNKWGYDAGLWVLNPFIDRLGINPENAWNYTFADSVWGVLREKRVCAVPGNAIEWIKSVRGEVPFGYIAPGMEGSILLLDWNGEEVRRGFNFHKFDVNKGVPQKGSIGTKMNKFYGLRQDVPASALYVYSDLVALGSGGFEGSGEGLRVVFVREADAQKNAT